MPLTIALSGMDTATETALRAAFAGANARLGEPFLLVAEPDAEHVIVDMDSMYGPMSWLRLHAAGKQIIGLTSAPRVQTHFRLGRPFDDTAMAALLREIAATQDVALDGPAPTLQSGAPAHAAVDAVAQASETREASIDTPSAEDAAIPTVTAAAPDAPPAKAGAAARPLDGADPQSALHPRAETNAPLTEPAPQPEPERALPFATWLSVGVLRGRRRYRRETGPSLWIDFDAQHYHGPTTLKPLSQYFDGVIERDAIEAVDDATWSREAQASGAPQPLVRLVWLGGLLAGDGTLAPAHDPDARFLLNKWPQTEREYPRHFRIATAMMKGPATLDEIIAASGLPAEDVIRFVNANLATGYAEPFRETPDAVEATARQGGFFARLRGR
ncbi:hypothetical protein [Luteimonas terrae]|uniref:Uncharacterized protein n=1 Tax=Luteimonas terrae TaxID=1530191 RepID=A0ABU1XRS8_9GAMM|nr:hypothetical protein [Luteimonas terrae]MDR7191464.1 hypothetical protein [Luteimonas terrae]